MDHLPEALYCVADTRSAERRAMGMDNGATNPGAVFSSVRGDELASGLLMERAGNAAFHLLRERFPRVRRITVLCGPGNNGGDGYVLARLAREAGFTVVVVSPAGIAGLKGEAAAAKAAWHKAGGTLQTFSIEHLQTCDLIVDALFGTGLERPLEGVWRVAIEAMNTSNRPVFALDTPSGLHADSGRVLGVAVHAVLTLSFIGLKAGLFTGQGREHSGLILFDDLGVSDTVFSDLKPLARRITERNLRGLLATRKRHAHKGDNGRVLVVGGQPGMSGAVRLAGEAAYRAGAGLVTLATHPQHAALVSMLCPELMGHGVKDVQALEPLLASADVFAAGPGLGQGEWGHALWQSLLAVDKPLVVDADALNLLAVQPALRADWVLTPHPGEAARLLGVSVAEIEADRFAAAHGVAQRYGGVCVLKGSGTLVAKSDELSMWLCDRGNPGMATGGSGDVLTGVIAGLLAQGLTPGDAARVGVWVHASAGDHVAAGGERGLMASDLLAPLRHSINDVVAYAA